MNDNDGFDFGGFIKNIGKAFMFVIIGIISFYIYLTMVQPMIANGTMNITAWSPQVAQFPITIIPMAILVAIVVGVIVIFFKKQKPANPYVQQMEQQMEAQRVMQRRIPKQKINKTVIR